MSNLLVSLISDQTIPNFLFIKTFTKSTDDEYLFLTTNKMENEEKNKRKWILESANIAESKQFKITVDAENKLNVTEKLSKFDFSIYKKILVNLTGGTKMMSIAAYEFFKENQKSELWYLPIGKNTYHICDFPKKQRAIKYKMSVEEYLNCCGIFKSKNQYTQKEPLKSKDFVENHFNKIGWSPSVDISDKIERLRLFFRSDNASTRITNKLRNDNLRLDHKLYVNEIKEFNDKEKDERYHFDNFDWVGELFKSLHFKLGEYLLKRDIDFITGGWFEEYVYYIVKQLISNHKNCLKLGIGLNPNSKNQENAARYFTNNDLDVVFVHNNELYVVECKSGGMDANDLYNKTVYLASALKKYFGLSVKSVLCTLSEMGSNKKEKSEILGVIPIDRENFNLKGRFKEILNLSI